MTRWRIILFQSVWNATGKGWVRGKGGDLVCRAKINLALFSRCFTLTRGGELHHTAKLLPPLAFLPYSPILSHSCNGGNAHNWRQQQRVGPRRCRLRHLCRRQLERGRPPSRNGHLSNRLEAVATVEDGPRPFERRRFRRRCGVPRAAGHERRVRMAVIVGSQFPIRMIARKRFDLSTPCARALVGRWSNDTHTWYGAP